MQEEEGKSRRWVLAYVSEEEVVWLSAERRKETIPHVRARVLQDQLCRIKGCSAQGQHWLLLEHFYGLSFFLSNAPFTGSSLTPVVRQGMKHPRLFLSALLPTSPQGLQKQ